VSKVLIVVYQGSFAKIRVIGGYTRIYLSLTLISPFVRFSRLAWHVIRSPPAGNNL